MLADTLRFLIEALGNLFLIAVLLRFYMQALRVPFRNPFAQFVVAVTDFAVKPMRRVVPGLLGQDMASLVLAWLVQYALLIVLFWLGGFPFLLAAAQALPALALLAIVKLAGLFVYLIMGITFMLAILSWVNPMSPIAPILSVLTEPFLRPIRRVMPAVANFDLSPLVLLLAAQVVLMLPLAALERAVLTQF
jgi:YggT family protein